MTVGGAGAARRAVVTRRIRPHGVCVARRAAQPRRTTRPRGGSEVSRLLRHANPRVTTTVYGGINDDAATAIGNKLTNAGFGT